MVRRNFKIGGIDTSNVNISANGFATTLTANATLASNVSFSLPGADGNSGQVLATDGGGNLFFADSSANTQAYVGDSLLSNTALILEAGDGVSVSGNTVSGVVSFSTSMSNVTSQVISVDGSANSFSLTKSVSNSHMVLVSYNGLLQDPTTYSVSGTTLTISNTKPLLADSTVEVRYFDFFSLPGATESSGGGGSSYVFGGTNYGYVTGGEHPTYGNRIHKFPLTSDTSTTQVATLSAGTRWEHGGHSSDTHGYMSGGVVTSVPTYYYNKLDKFPFASDTAETNVGDVYGAAPASGVRLTAGLTSENYGYIASGYWDYGPFTSIDSSIYKFPFASDTSGSLGAALASARIRAIAQNSATNGYVSGGSISGPNTDNIQKFPFSSDSNATDIGELTIVSGSAAGQSSETSGYVSGGSPNTDTIQKFSFTSDGSASDIANLTQGRSGASGISSTVSGYTAGSPAPVGGDTIDKFPFASDTDATDVGEIAATHIAGAGHQY